MQVRLEYTYVCQNGDLKAHEVEVPAVPATVEECPFMRVKDGDSTIELRAVTLLPDPFGGQLPTVLCDCFTLDGAKIDTKLVVSDPANECLHASLPSTPAANTTVGMAAPAEPGTVAGAPACGLMPPSMTALPPAQPPAHPSAQDVKPVEDLAVMLDDELHVLPAARKRTASNISTTTPSVTVPTSTFVGGGVFTPTEGASVASGLAQQLKKKQRPSPTLAAAAPPTALPSAVPSSVLGSLGAGLGAGAGMGASGAGAGASGAGMGASGAGAGASTSFTAELLGHAPMSSNVAGLFGVSTMAPAQFGSVPPPGTLSVGMCSGRDTGLSRVLVPIPGPAAPPAALPLQVSSLTASPGGNVDLNHNHSATTQAPSDAVSNMFDRSTTVQYGTPASTSGADGAANAAVSVGKRKKGAARSQVSRRCAEPGCQKRAAQGTQRCKAHGGGRRCKVPGCPKSAQGSTNRCVAHGGGRHCSVENCSKVARGSTPFCVAHGGGYRCNMPGCTKGARGATGRCKAHGGGQRCQHPGCKKSAQTKGLCTAHGKLYPEHMAKKAANVHGSSAQARVMPLQLAKSI